MSEEFENVEYEDDEPHAATKVEILPPERPRPRLTPRHVVIAIPLALFAISFGTHLGKVVSGPAEPIGARQAMVTTDLPISDNVEDKRAEAPPRAAPAPRWHYGVTPKTELAPVSSGRMAYSEPEDEEPPEEAPAPVYRPDPELERFDRRMEQERLSEMQAPRRPRKPSRGLWPLIEEFDSDAQMKVERYKAYAREKQRLHDGGY
jgi:hypothetical protein